MPRRRSDDGFVTLADVLALTLDADLAVLSACVTGLGRERRGEGTQSLARAFLYAGARSEVASLWQVDDRETERTMQDFYEGLAVRGMTASEALREARLAIRRAAAAPDSFRGVGRGKLLTHMDGPVPATTGRPELAAIPSSGPPSPTSGRPTSRRSARAAARAAARGAARRAVKCRSGRAAAHTLLPRSGRFDRRGRLR